MRAPEPDSRPRFGGRLEPWAPCARASSENLIHCSHCCCRSRLAHAPFVGSAGRMGTTASNRRRVAPLTRGKLAPFQRSPPPRTCVKIHFSFAAAAIGVSLARSGGARAKVDSGAAGPRVRDLCRRRRWNCGSRSLPTEGRHTSCAPVSNGADGSSATVGLERARLAPDRRTIWCAPARLDPGATSRRARARPPFGQTRASGPARQSRGLQIGRRRAKFTEIGWDSARGQLIGSLNSGCRRKLQASSAEPARNYAPVSFVFLLPSLCHSHWHSCSLSFACPPPREHAEWRSNGQLEWIPRRRARQCDSRVASQSEARGRKRAESAERSFVPLRP